MGRSGVRWMILAELNWGRGRGGMCLCALLCSEGEARPVSAMPVCCSFHAGSPVLVPPVALASQH